MENSEIINWVLLNKKNLNLKIFQLTELSYYFDDVFDYSVQIRTLEGEFVGRGSDKYEEIALTKAISEAIERFLVVKYGLKNSSGLAVHNSKTICMDNALSELIERDSYMCSFLCGIKFKPINNQETVRINKILKLKNISINFFELSKVNDGITVMAFVNEDESKRNDKIFFGCSFSKIINEAVWHSSIEAIRDYIDKKTEIPHLNISENDFLKLDRHTFYDHKLLSLDSEYTKKYFNSRTSDLEIPQPDLRNVEYVEFPLRKILFDCPLVAFQAKSQKLQEVWEGLTNESSLNIERLSEITSVDKLVKIPHFFN